MCSWTRFIRNFKKLNFSLSENDKKNSLKREKAEQNSSRYIALLYWFENRELTVLKTAFLSLAVSVNFVKNLFATTAFYNICSLSNAIPIRFLKVLGSSQAN